ncbi:hypothetical protein [Legionella shakespearei]|uniref:WH2 domain-containing protein n=1 Tax=Legionella shakespearei DSM 23087 TaxID=1122169 RepID=A0A0W0YHM9_9GAMM|nr:hypothetical protein [Legionella shakespearei]KTD56457.1 hypothetical protein Lsha_2856 [Legionella shakespearei DSM 23087]
MYIQNRKIVDLSIVQYKHYIGIVKRTLHWLGFRSFFDEPILNLIALSNETKGDLGSDDIITILESPDNNDLSESAQLVIDNLSNIYLDTARNEQERGLLKVKALTELALFEEESQVSRFEYLFGTTNKASVFYHGLLSSVESLLARKSLEQSDLEDITRRYAGEKPFLNKMWRTAITSALLNLKPVKVETHSAEQQMEVNVAQEVPRPLSPVDSPDIENNLSEENDKQEELVASPSPVDVPDLQQDEVEQEEAPIETMLTIPEDPAPLPFVDAPDLQEDKMELDEPQIETMLSAPEDPAPLPSVDVPDLQEDGVELKESQIEMLFVPEDPAPQPPVDEDINIQPVVAEQEELQTELIKESEETITLPVHEVGVCEQDAPQIDKTNESETVTPQILVDEHISVQDEVVEEAIEPEVVPPVANAVDFIPLPPPVELPELPLEEKAVALPEHADLAVELTKKDRFSEMAHQSQRLFKSYSSFFSKVNSEREEQALAKVANESINQKSRQRFIDYCKRLEELKLKIEKLCDEAIQLDSSLKEPPAAASKEQHNKKHKFLGKASAKFKGLAENNTLVKKVTQAADAVRDAQIKYKYKRVLNRIKKLQKTQFRILIDTLILSLIISDDQFFLANSSTIQSMCATAQALTKVVTLTAQQQRELKVLIDACNLRMAQARDNEQNTESQNQQVMHVSNDATDDGSTVVASNIPVAPAPVITEFKTAFHVKSRVNSASAKVQEGQDEYQLREALLLQIREGVQLKKSESPELKKNNSTNLLPNGSILSVLAFSSLLKLNSSEDEDIRDESGWSTQNLSYDDDNDTPRLKNHKPLIKTKKVTPHQSLPSAPSNDSLSDESEELSLDDLRAELALIRGIVKTEIVMKNEDECTVLANGLFPS